MQLEWATGDAAAPGRKWGWLSGWSDPCGYKKWIPQDTSPNFKIQRQEVSGSEIWHLRGVAKLSDEQLDEELRGAGLQNSRGSRGQVLTPPRNRLRFPSFSCNVTACELRKRRNHRNRWHCHILSLRIKSDATHLPSLQESTCLQQPPELRRHRGFRIFPVKIGTTSRDHIKRSNL